MQQLGQLPEADVRAMATYLASFNAPRADAPVASALVAQSHAPEALATGPAQRLFSTACGACHHDGSGPQLLGQNIPLALNTNLHSARPDNLLRVLLDGIQRPASAQQGFMPAFRHAFDDAQLAELAAYLRGRFAPDEPAWPDLASSAARLRATAPAD